MKLDRKYVSKNRISATARHFSQVLLRDINSSMVCDRVCGYNVNRHACCTHYLVYGKITCLVSLNSAKYLHSMSHWQGFSEAKYFRYTVLQLHSTFCPMTLRINVIIIISTTANNNAKYVNSTFGNYYYLQLR